MLPLLSRLAWMEVNPGIFCIYAHNMQYMETQSRAHPFL